MVCGVVGQCQDFLVAGYHIGSRMAAFGFPLVPGKPQLTSQGAGALSGSTVRGGLADPLGISIARLPSAMETRIDLLHEQVIFWRRQFDVRVE